MLSSESNIMRTSGLRSITNYYLGLYQPRKLKRKRGKRGKNGSLMSKSFLKILSLNKRAYEVLFLRYLFYSKDLLVFLRYDGDSSFLVQQLRYHLLNHRSNMQLLHSSLLQGVINTQANSFLNTRVFVLYSSSTEYLLGALKDIEKFFDHFPFLAFSYRTIICQQPKFFFIEQFNASFFLHFYSFFCLRLLVICLSIFMTLIIVLRLLLLKGIQ